MTEQVERTPIQQEAESVPATAGGSLDPAAYEVDDIRGWALQWDHTALRKASLARTMRTLRQGAEAE